VPTNVDDVFFDANSGNCTVNASARTAKTLNFTGYTNTITMSNTITVSGNVTLGAGMGIVGASALIVNATATITSNGKTWANPLTFTNTITITLADNLSVTGLITVSGNTTINGSFNINGNGGVANGGYIAKGTGSPKLYFKGGTVSSTNTTARYAIDTYIDGNITIASILAIGDNGSIRYVSGVVTNTANNTVYFINTVTAIDLGAITLNNVITQNALNSFQFTLESDLNINGLFSSVGGTVNGSFNINCYGGFLGYQGGNIAAGTGSPTLNLLGGTWSTSAVTSLRLNTNINGNITISGTVYYNTRTLTYTSGTVTTTGSTLIIGDFANTILNTGSLSWNNLTIANQLTITLQSDLNIGGLLTVNAGNHLHTFNGTFNINCSGGLTINSTGLVQGTGTTTLNILGGTWTGGQIRLNTNINGNVTLTNINYGTGTLTYVSGNITLVGTANVSGSLNVAGIFWNNLTTGNNTLLSDLNVRGLLTATGNITFSGAYNVNLYGGITHPGYLQCSGTPKPIINLYGGIFTSNQLIDTTINLLGNVTWQSVGLDLNSTINYISGIISGTNTSLLSIYQGGNTLLNFDKISILRTVNFTNNANVTMNRFFNGSASYPTRIQSTTATGIYLIIFQDTFEKIANNVKVSGCTLSRPGQLIVNGANSNKGNNTGIRFGNQSPNGLPKNTPTIKTETIFGIGNISDPTMVVN
jgi:hypothetical protein